MNTLFTVATLVVGVLPTLAAGETHTIQVEGMKFQPETVTVRRGDTVVWHNRDIVPHTATATAAGEGGFDSGLVASGASWSWTAARAGRFDYVCTYHPGMKATVVVR